MTTQEFTPQPVRGQTFKGQVIRMDGFRFENCEFIACTMVYAGGPADCSSCRFHPDTVWKFEGPAATLMEVLPRFGWRFVFGVGPDSEPVRFPSDAL